MQRSVLSGARALNVIPILRGTGGLPGVGQNGQNLRKPAPKSKKQRGLKAAKSGRNQSETAPQPRKTNKNMGMTFSKIIKLFVQQFGEHLRNKLSLKTCLTAAQMRRRCSGGLVVGVQARLKDVRRLLSRCWSARAYLGCKRLGRWCRHSPARIYKEIMRMFLHFTEIPLISKIQ